VKKVRPEVKVIVLSMHNDSEYMQRSANLGANGYLPKDADSQEFLNALDAVVSGENYFKEVIVPQSKNPNADILSSREIEVLRHLSNGLSSKQIAGQLDISTRTVETHRLNIMKKLNTTNSAETISVAARLNLI
jgi:DNA-binding NarL/FixJ family response regulator